MNWRGGFMLPLIAIMAIILALIAWQFGFGNQGAPATPQPLLAPTDVTATAAQDAPGAIDVTFRYPGAGKVPRDEAPIEIHVVVDGQIQPAFISIESDPNAVNSTRVTGLPCATAVTVQVGAYGRSTDAVSAPPVQAFTGACATATPAPTPIVVASPSGVPATPTGAPQADMPTPVITMVEPKDEAFVVHFRYPEEGAVIPSAFDVLVNGELYETTPYTGSHVEYSRFVSDQPCGATLEVQIVAVSGDVRSASATQAAETEPC